MRKLMMKKGEHGFALPKDDIELDCLMILTKHKGKSYDKYTEIHHT